jgi:hypothetical protein
MAFLINILLWALKNLITEAFVFGYLGLTFFSYTELKWSPMLFGIELLVIVFGRLMGTFGLVTFLKIFGYKQEMSMKELLFVWYAGIFII